MKDNNIIDITASITHDMTTWPGEDGVVYRIMQSIKRGDDYNVNKMIMGLHIGTHIDAPLHLIDDDMSIDQIALSHFIGEARVIFVDTKKCITAHDIMDKNITKDDIILFKTINSENPETEPFFEDYIYIDDEAAQFLVDKKIKTVGIDYMSVEDFYTENNETHKLLLSNRIGIIEGLNLKDVDEGVYFLSCLPLKIVGLEASPCRAVLIKNI